MDPRRVAISMLMAAAATAAAHGELDPAQRRAEALAGYVKVNPSDGGSQSLYTLYVKPDSREILAELPANYEEQMLLYGLCVSRGLTAPGIHGGTLMVHWKRYGDRLALVRPQTDVRTSGDLESRRSREDQFTDMVRFDIPIVAEGEGGGPIIDLDDLLIDQSTLFFQWEPGGVQPRLATVKHLKVFPDNFTLAVEMPWDMPGQDEDGTLVTLAYSFSLLPAENDYTSRAGDPRVGYFLTGFYDLDGVAGGDMRRRLIKRWKLEKADPSLALSPPRSPIVFYIDHKTPVRWRRWVRDGILEWNKAFEKVGIVNAIEVYQQDAQTGAHMDKDPENVRYNFVVWNSNDLAFAIGPCRVDPRTGRILDADVVMNDGWVRAAVEDYRAFLAEVLVEGMGAETTRWLRDNPRWDPAVLLGGAERSERARNAPPGMMRITRDAAGRLAHDASLDACSYGDCRAIDMALARLGLLDLHASPYAEVPEEFIGEQIKDVIMHEIGHVLGLRHNFKASTVYSIDQINSPEWRDQKKPISGSVMDYNAVNFNADESRVQGPHFMTTLGPYDYWAIRCGYAPDGELEQILAQADKPEHVYLTDEDLYGPDPGARTRDLGSDVLDFVSGEMSLVQRLRARITERALKKGQSYQKARDAYMTLLYIHARSLGVLVRQVGGVHIYRDLYGESSRNPTAPVDPQTQRQALRQLMVLAFRDESYGLTPELLDKMSMDKWFDGQFVPQDIPDAQLDVHDLVLNLQASVLTNLFNPTRVRRILDNEFRIPADHDAFTLAELLTDVRKEVWSELDAAGQRPSTPREPLISSLRRNLQREHLDRMIAMTLPGGLTGAASRPVAALAAAQLRDLHDDVARVLDQHPDLDPYTASHLEDARLRIERALDAVYIYR